MTDAPLVSRDFWSFLHAARGTSLAGVPTSYEMLERLNIQEMHLPSLHTLTQAGGALAADKVQYFDQLARTKGWRFFVMYGQTEATARMAYLPPELAGDHPDAIGQPIPGGHFHLVDPEGHIIENTNVIGELIYQGPNVMLGYVQNRHDLSHLDPPSQLHTGDLACRNSAGLYLIKGRLNRFIKMHGHRLSLDDLEALLRKKGIEALCAGGDHQLIIAHQPSQSPSEIAQHLHNLARLLPRDYRLVSMDTWPRTPSGKIAYDQIKALAQYG
jgi:acyl-coenzyme A synthetase/AMP-(fatty) acid ligase